MLAHCDATLDATSQEELSVLVADLLDGVLSAPKPARLDEIMAAYRGGLLLKARAEKRCRPRAAIVDGLDDDRL